MTGTRQRSGEFQSPRRQDARYPSSCRARACIRGDMDETWEAVHTIDDWYDGPRGGVADFRGAPHYYRTVFLDPGYLDPEGDHNPHGERPPDGPGARRVRTRLRVGLLAASWLTSALLSILGGDEAIVTDRWGGLRPTHPTPKRLL